MSTEQELEKRSSSSCELCGASDNLCAYEVAPSDGTADQSILLCAVCLEQVVLS